MFLVDSLEIVFSRCLQLITLVWQNWIDVLVDLPWDILLGQIGIDMLHKFSICILDTELSKPSLHAFSCLIKCLELIHQDGTRAVLMVNMIKTFAKRSLICGRHVVLNVILLVLWIVIDLASVSSSNALDVRTREPKNCIKSWRNKHLRRLFLRGWLYEEVSVAHLCFSINRIQFNVWFVSTQSLF